MVLKNLMSLNNEEKQPDKLIKDNVAFRTNNDNRMPHIWLMLWDICHYKNVKAIKAIEIAVIDYHTRYIQKPGDKNK